MRKVHQRALAGLVRYTMRVERAYPNNVSSQMAHDHMVKPYGVSDRKVNRWLSRLVKAGLATREKERDHPGLATRKIRNQWLYQPTEKGRRHYDRQIGSF